MSVIEPMEMVKIRFVEEWVSPDEIHEKTKYEESTTADRCEPCRLRSHKDIDVLDHSGKYASRPIVLTVVLMFRGNDPDTRHAIDNGIYLPVRAESEKDCGCIPPSTQSAEKSKKYEEG